MFETTRRHIFLAGFMGTGKTAVGRVIADQLGWAFIDLDSMTEMICHRSIPEIFMYEGEEAFRNYESRALRLAVNSHRTVIALGGGTPLRAANANVIRATGRCWLLTASLEIIWDRVRHDLAGRPILGALAAEPGRRDLSFEQFSAFAQALIVKRQDAYQSVATHVLDTTHRSIEEIASKIVSDFMRAATPGLNQ